ncbi:2,3-diaminopropionate biosynthesis protein SbnB [Chitinophaga varians]|uniref:2,3-diaminopropionate biosynthesis protein SbnB n=1 Tax=Chitinophaga varians TaxID=2202339 RepID=UPI00165F60AA|nr:2,3-diaminopropionate biosynthesis protein SbnB [Chitinophaga varians]MBC9913421.1 2,3-diaminopropionate biosynthesis protein SbnB [Chitinophaga varians]
MVLLDEKYIINAGIDWNRTIDVIEDAVRCIGNSDFSQPIKPYLRYRNLRNRIIAMPAFVGGDINMAGIKWIASFPDNIKQGVPRAHSVVILNNADTGEPVGIFCTALLSIIRTASVSGLLLRHFIRQRNPDKVKVGITGFGPIGQYHLKMCQALLGERIERISLFDIRPIDAVLTDAYDNVEVVDTWEAAFQSADIFITCTVSDAPYINIPPKPGSLHLNVSLRDYRTDVYPWFKGAIIVDDWEEVCREKTDIEMLHLEQGLQKEDTRSIVDVVNGDCLAQFPPDAPVMFNPMGMAVFDIAIGSYYLKQAPVPAV